MNLSLNSSFFLSGWQHKQMLQTQTKKKIAATIKQGIATMVA
jgi:hypothetical protein